jgi:exonuclease III
MKAKAVMLFIWPSLLWSGGSPTLLIFFFESQTWFRCGCFLSVLLRTLAMWLLFAPLPEQGLVHVPAVMLLNCFLHFMDEQNTEFNFISWNVLGLNSKAKREEVKQIMQIHKPSIVCLQETKLAVVNDLLISQCLGPMYVHNFRFLPAEGTKGGIILACRDAWYQFSDDIVRSYMIFAMVTDCRTGSSWTITGVYGPQDNLSKRLFLKELRELKDQAKLAWLIVGEFNMIYLDQDKSNDRLDRRMMSRSRRTLNHLEVKEIQLVRRRFTWSNEQSSPTMLRIDRAFSSIAWEDLYPDPIVTPLSSSSSDHCPLKIHSQVWTSLLPRFRFKMHWPLMPGFLECVQQSWSKSIVNPQNTMTTLHIKLSRTAKALAMWSHKLIP